MNVWKRTGRWKPVILLAFGISLALPAISFRPETGRGRWPRGEHFKGEGKGLHFFIISDWGWNGYKAQQVVADQMARSAEAIEPEFIISCGDNFQVQGVASVQDPLWISNYENVYREVALQVDWFPVLGNHDYKGNTQAEIDYSHISRRWRMEARYYTFVKRVNDSVSARFIFLDTSPFVKDYWHRPDFPDIVKQDTAAQWAWLKQVLAGSREQWNLVFGHHPVFSGSKVHGNTQELMEQLKPLLEQYHAQIYFSGHDHDLQHLKSGGVDYIVTGAGGEPRPSAAEAQTVFEASEPAFSSVSLFADSIRVNFIGGKGQTIYSMSRNYH